MPTGYTAKLMDNGQTFEEFVMTCAKGMGACASMREDSFDTPIPERFEPSSYNNKKCDEARVELSILENLDDRVKYGQDKKDKDIANTKQYLRDNIEANERIMAMVAEVAAWAPPTEDHREFKKFMLNQLNISRINIDYVMRDLELAERKTPLEYYQEAVTQAKNDIHYRSKAQYEENERTERNNKWLKDLRDSI